jgi:NAD+ synthetase
MPILDPTKVVENRIEAIRDYHKEAGTEKAEIDVSGGIDSAVMLMLLSKALGPDNVTSVYSNIHSSIESLRRARDVARIANVNLVELDLSEAYDGMIRNFTQSLIDAKYPIIDIENRIKKDPTILGSFRSCIRAPVGRVLNRMTGGGIRHGTGNEDEDRWLRFYQKGGDGEVDTNPLAMLSKGEVYQLAVKLGVPSEIITCMPTPDLWGTGDAHNDEEELSKLSGVEWTYSRVNPETGEYTQVGTIERMSRFADHVGYNIVFLGSQNDIDVICQNSILLDEFRITKKHVESARKWERSTRHKENPNCQSLGTRQDLLALNIITNDLPKTVAIRKG